MSADFAAAREIMVDSQVRPQDVTDLAIQDAMRVVRRESLVPPGKMWLAYADAEVEYAPGRWMLSPRDVAKLLQGVRPRRGEEALAIAAPYAAAVLKVTRLDSEDLNTVTGQWPLIVCEGAVCRTPQAWLEAIAPGGRLALVERRGATGQAVIYVRADAGVGARPLFDCAAPVMAGFQAETRFVF
jgi:protein-L-isoaspartate(D-aspartate) O-methyltransferase